MSPSFVWITPTVPPNGSVNSFQFTTQPICLSWNGLEQVEGVGYTLVESGGSWIVQLEDSNGQIVTPNAGDDLHALVAGTSGSETGPGLWDGSTWNTLTP